MSNIIVKGNFTNDLLKSQINEYFGNYKPIDTTYQKIATVVKSSQAFEKSTEATDFGVATQKGETEENSYSSLSEGYSALFNHINFGLGYQVSDDALADSQSVVGTGLSIENNNKKLMAALERTKDQYVTNVLNRAFNSSYVGGDGSSLCSDSHPVKSGGTQSNILPTPATFTQTAVEDLINLAENSKDTVGNIKSRVVKKLVVPQALYFEALRIFGSEKESGNGNNTMNVLKGTNIEIVKNLYLTSDTKYYVITDIDSGIVYYDRNPGEIGIHQAFDFRATKVWGFFRASAGWIDWRGVYASGNT